MQLTSKTLKNVDGLNAWAFADNWVVRRDGDIGEQVTLYFQIVDLDRDAIRYIPAVGSTMQVVIPSLNDADTLTLTATNPFVDDRSIWSISLLSTQVPSASVVRFSLTEGGATRSWSALQALRVEKLNAGGC